MKLKSGFSIIEISIALVVIGLLVATVGPAAFKMLGKAKETTTRSTLNTLKSAITDYSDDMGHFPNKAEGGLNALVERPKGPSGKKWKGIYLEGQTEVPADGWNNEIQYNCPPVQFKDRYKRFEIFSYGEQGEGGSSEPIHVGA